MRAAQEGHKEVAVTLLEQGALVSDRQVRGSTALHLAVAGGHSEMVTLLLDHGVDISAVDDIVSAASCFSLMTSLVALISGPRCEIQGPSLITAVG